MPAGFSFRDQYNVFVNYQSGSFTDGSYARDVLRITSGKGDKFDPDFAVGLLPTATGTAGPELHVPPAGLARISTFAPLGRFLEVFDVHEYAEATPSSSRVRTVRRPLPPGQDVQHVALIARDARPQLHEPHHLRQHRRPLGAERLFNHRLRPHPHRRRD